MSPDSASSADPVGVVPGAEIPHRQRVFCNRNLRLDEIDVIGFDMDYTLALYHQRRIEELSIECTLDKLVKKRGYGEALLGLDYDHTFALRGLVIDRPNGNLLKMDRFGHVDVVYHGRQRMPKQQRHELYRNHTVRLSSERYAVIDTLFALPEAVMFARIVEHLDQAERPPRYGELWQDIRDCIDEAHRDETMKRIIKAHLGDYIVRDAELAQTLHKLRSAGKRMFLLTNSAWDYTSHVMTWLLDGQLSPYPTWRNYFDLIVVGAQKPVFFTERRPFIELDDAGSERGAPGGSSDGPPQLLRGRVYQAGNVGDLQAALGCPGHRTLYVGDHIYGDMLRAKKDSVWRTAMVIQELEHEIDVAARLRPQIERIEELERQRVRLDSELIYQQLLQRSRPRGDGGGSTNGESSSDLQRLDARRRADAIRQRLRELGGEIAALEEEIDRAFNPFWGALFRVGVENSRFGEQVEDYACVYTSRVSNFLAYSPLRYFRSPRDHMPHEL